MQNNSFNVDFIGISDQRAASSWIRDALKEHPEICMSRRYETSFFNKSYEKGLDFYENYFSDCEGGEKIKGEYSPQYLHDPKAPERIARHFPEVKLISVLRNPIDRLYSIYWFNRLGGTGSSWQYKSFEYAIEDEDFLSRGLYAEKVQRFLQYFPREQIFFVLYEDLNKDAVKFIQNIYKFLGVDDNYVPSNISGKFNKSGDMRLKRTAPVKLFFKTVQFVKNIFGNSVIRKIKNNKRIYSVYRKFIIRNREMGDTGFKKPEMQPETRQKLYNYFKEDINKLEKLTGLDLNHWK